MTATMPAMPTAVARSADRTGTAPRPRPGSTARPVPMTTGAAAPAAATRFTMRAALGDHAACRRESRKRGEQDRNDHETGRHERDVHVPTRMRLLPPEAPERTDRRRRD